MSRVCLLFLGAITFVNAIDTYTLSPIDSSLALNGEFIVANHSGKIIIAVQNCAGCSVKVDGVFEIYKGVTFTDGKGKQYMQNSNSDIGPNLYLAPPVTLETVGNAGGYIVAFSLTNGNDTVERGLTNYGIYTFSYADPVQTLEFHKGRNIWTVYTPLQSSTVNKITMDSGCTISLYSGGSPMEAGKEKHLLIRLSSDDASHWVASDIFVPFLTIVVDPGCAAQVQLTRNKDPSIPIVVPGNIGLIVSAQYPGTFDYNRYRYDQWRFYAYEANDRQQVTFDVDIVSVDTGSDGRLNCSIFKPPHTLYSQIYSPTVNSLDSNFKHTGYDFSLDWHPSQPSNGFLLRFKVSNGVTAQIIYIACLLPLLFLF